MIGRKKEVSTVASVPQPVVEEVVKEDTEKKVLQELYNLENDKYYRLRTLQLLERIALALESSLEESEVEETKE